ncbi:MAG: tetratricopeptide repeat protein, partial [Candidatus Acidiferrales bacterium]
MFSRRHRCWNLLTYRNFRGDLLSLLPFLPSVLAFVALSVVVVAPTFARGQAQAQTHAGQAAALIEQGRAQAAAGKFPDAIASYQEALRLSPHSLQAEIGAVQAYRGVHNFDEAKKILEQAHREHPRSAAPLAV